MRLASTHTSLSTLLLGSLCGALFACSTEQPLGSVPGGETSTAAGAAGKTPHDSDGVGDTLDCAPTEPGVAFPPEPVNGSLRLDKTSGTTLHWDRSVQGHTYNVYRGERLPGQPFVLFAGPSNPANLNLVCPGSVDIGTPPLYQDLVILMNGTQDPAFTIGPDGTTHFQGSVPMLPSNTSLGSIQGAVFQPYGSTCQVLLTAAFELSIQ